MEIVRSQDEISDVLDWCINEEDEGRTHYAGQTYEEGIQAMWMWLTGQSDDHPNGKE